MRTRTARGLRTSSPDGCHGVDREFSPEEAQALDALRDQAEVEAAEVGRQLEKDVQRVQQYNVRLSQANGRRRGSWPG